MASRLVKQPRRGECIEHGAYGTAAVVEAVHDHGRRLEIYTEVHGAETIERAPAGWWTRATK